MRMQIEVQVRRVFLVAVASVASALGGSLLGQSTVSTRQTLSGPSEFTLQTPFELTEAGSFDPAGQQNQSVPPPVPNQAPVPALPPYLPATVPAPELPPPTPASHPFPTYNAYDPGLLRALPDRSGSVYIPVDNWIYPELVRLYELGYADTLSLGMDAPLCPSRP
jgi:hypothetical protein